MPMHNGKYYRLDEWRAIQEAESAETEAPVESAEPAEDEAPHKRAPRASKKDAAAQVMAALGITPEATEDTEPAEAEPEQES